MNERVDGWDTVVNVGDAERLVSLAGGGWLALTGLFRSGLVGLLKVGLGSYLLYRGTTGYCPIYESAGVDTAGGGEDWDWDSDWDEGEDPVDAGPVAGSIGGEAPVHAEVLVNGDPAIADAVTEGVDEGG